MFGNTKFQGNNPSDSFRLVFMYSVNRVSITQKIFPVNPHNEPLITALLRNDSAFVWTPCCQLTWLPPLLHSTWQTQFSKCIGDADDGLKWKTLTQTRDALWARIGIGWLHSNGYFNKVQSKLWAIRQPCFCCRRRWCRWCWRWWRGGAAVAATVASIIAAVRKVGQANNKNAPKRSRQAQSTSLSNELKHHAPRPRFRPLRPSPHRRPHPHPHPHPQLHLHSRFHLCSTLCRVFVFILFQHLPLSIPYPHL